MVNRAQELSDEAVNALRRMGWDFVPTGPNEWDWLKFGRHEQVIATGGDRVWALDVVKAEMTEAGDVPGIVAAPVEPPTWKATMELRWKYTAFPFGRVGQPFKFPELQQLWRCGEATEWRKVPSLLDPTGKPS